MNSFDKDFKTLKAGLYDKKSIVLNFKWLKLIMKSDLMICYYSISHININTTTWCFLKAREQQLCSLMCWPWVEVNSSSTHHCTYYLHVRLPEISQWHKLKSNRNIAFHWSFPIHLGIKHIFQGVCVHKHMTDITCDDWSLRYALTNAFITGPNGSLLFPDTPETQCSIRPWHKASVLLLVWRLCWGRQRGVIC